MNVSMKRCLAALGLAAAVGATASAQQNRVGPKWLGWVGCWTTSVPGAAAVASPAENDTFVCITPSALGGDAAEVTTITAGKIISTQRIDASGAERPLEAKGCTGVQRASWSADERRIYLRSSSTCDGLKSTTSGILSMTATGEWLDVRGVSSYGSENVRVARYRDAGIPASIPAEIANALRERSGGMEAARITAGAPIGATGVMEASRAADSTVVAAWLLEREQRFVLDASTLVQLADAGVPGAVTDALVAVSNPGAFRLARVPDRSDVILTDQPTRARRVSAMAVPYDPWTWGSLGLYDYRYGNPYGYRYGGYGYGYGYGYNNGYYGGYAPPIIIVNGDAQGAAAGQMVKGRGYTQPGGTSTGATAHERPSRTSEPSPSPSSSSGSSSSGGSSSGGSSEGGRTAKPRS
jgi:hypothetical protein